MSGEHGEYEGPCVAGHEIAGIVDAIGKDVTYVKPGDRVMCSLMAQQCGTCDQCLKGRNMWFCRTRNAERTPTPPPSPLKLLNGEPVRLAYGVAGFSTYTNATEHRLCKIDDDIPFEIASAISCGFVSGFAAVLNRLRIFPGESFAVAGCGGVGLSAVMGARYCGAIPIIAIDPQQVKLDAAVKFGATHTINPNEVDPVKAVNEITDGFGVNHSFVAVGGAGIKRSTFDLTAGDGQMNIVGHLAYKDEGMHELNFMEFLRGKRITGTILGDITIRRDVPKYMDMYRKGMVDIGALLTNRFKLDDIQEALDDSERGALKNVVICNEE
jgi:S-(hydroxymethyl)glutathione dehydrogenase/alcohol dehydrogenase